MATKKKEEELAAPEAQSGYDTSGLENRQQGPVTAPARA